MPPARSNPSGSVRGRLPSWGKRRSPAPRHSCFGAKDKDAGRRGNSLPITEEEKSSGGLSPGALGAEKGLRGSKGLQTVERVAKP